jgi:acyl carrier protein
MTIEGTPRTSSDLTGVVVSALGQLLGRSPDTIDPQMRLFEDLAFDSTGVLELLMLLETELGIEFDAETLEPNDFETVSSLVAYVVKESVR